MGTALPESGDASTLEVSGGKLELRRGASVHVSNFGGGGNAGSITIDVGELIIDGAFLRAETEGWGDAGTITIHAGSVAIGSGGAITSQTIGTGDAGDIQLDADSAVAATLDGTADAIRTIAVVDAQGYVWCEARLS